MNIKIIWVCFAVVLILALTPLSAEGKKFTDPFNYFTLPLPEGWSFLTVQLYGERQYIFSPNPLSFEALSKGCELDACFIYKTYAQSDAKCKQSIKQILKNSLEYRIKVYKEHGVDLKAGAITQGRAIGMKGFTVNISQPDENEFLFLGRKESRIHEVQYSYKLSKEDQYLPALKAMFTGLRLTNNILKARTKKFQNENRTFSITLPAKWHMKERDDNKTAQVFISREKVEKPEDRFYVGVTTLKIRRFSKSFNAPIKTNRDIINVWLGVLKKKRQEKNDVIFSLQNTKVDGKEGVLLEESLRIPGTNNYIQMLHLILAKDDTLYDIVLEAPVLEFDIFYDLFKKAVKTLRFE